MGNDTKINTLYFREKENWFKELLIKFKIIKPKYKTLGGIGEITIKGENE